MITFTWELGLAWLVLAVIVAVLSGFWRRRVDHEPPSQIRKRTQRRVLREMPPLTPARKGRS